MAEPTRFPANERFLDQGGLVRVPFLTWFRDLKAQAQAATQAVPSGIVRLTGQHASIVTTPIPTASLTAGLYRVSWYLQVTTPAGVSSDTTLTLTWTRNGVTQTFTGATVNGNTTATHDSEGQLLIRIDGNSPVSYAVAYNSNPAGAMVFELALALEIVSAD